MKTMITINNALKYYKEQELLSNSETYKEKLSEDLNEAAYRKMLGKICGKYFIPTWMVPTTI